MEGMSGSSATIGWLLDSDPSIRWPVRRELLHAHESEWQAERARVETAGWGVLLLSCEDRDGQWAGEPWSLAIRLARMD